MSMKLWMSSFILVTMFVSSARAEVALGECLQSSNAIKALSIANTNRRIESHLRKLFKLPEIGSLYVPSGCVEDFQVDVLAKLSASGGPRCDRVIVARNNGLKCKAGARGEALYHAILGTQPRGNKLRVISDKLPSDSHLLWSAELDRDHDHDGDGINNGDDLCPYQPENVNNMIDQDGCPDADRDQDGVVDLLDVCQLNRETKNGFQELDGCPDHAAEGLEKLSERLIFMPGQPKLSVISQSAIDEASLLLRMHTRSSNVIIEGFADIPNQPESSSKLSLERAVVLRDALVAAKVDGARLKAVGRGAWAGDSIEDMAQNRRARIVLTQVKAFARAHPDLSAFVGDFEATHFTLHVGSSLESCRISLRESPPRWLGPPGAQAGCYAASITGHRLVLHFHGSTGDFTVVLLQTDDRYRGLLLLEERSLSFSSET